MTAALTLFHTADVHRQTFADLAGRIAPQADLVHVVRADWLARAQGGIDSALAQEIADAMRETGGPVLCTCTTIGAAAESGGALRIDAPMMAAAAARPGVVLLVYGLASTREPSREMLMRALGGPDRIRELDLTALWPLFEVGERAAFHDAIAAALPDAPDIGAAVLAQASMAGAADRSLALPYPVFASPELALRSALGL